MKVGNDEEADGGEVVGDGGAVFCEEEDKSEIIAEYFIGDIFFWAVDFLFFVFVVVEGEHLGNVDEKEV